MNEIYRANEEGRLDKVLNERIPRSRTQIQSWIEQGRVRVDDEIVTRKSKIVRKGQEIDVEAPDLEPDNKEGIVPEDKPLQVLHEDDQIIVLHKPAGIIVHPTESITKGTTANRLVHHYPELASVGSPHRAGLAHRLDRGTSGVLVVARTEKALSSLKKQFKGRTVDKKYRTILSGGLADESLRVEVPIGYNSRNRMLRRADPAGRYAETTFRREAYNDEMTAVWCKPLTGRTHQIRVHAKHISHPVVGDEKYGGPGASRLMLHSEFIEFDHPGTNERTSFRVEPDQEVLSLWNDICSA